MNQGKSIKVNYFLNAFYQLLTLMTPLVTSPYMSRIFGADGLGVYSYSSSILGFFTMFAALGTSVYGQREIAQHRDQNKQMSQLFWEIELLSIITTCICLIIWIFAVFTAGTYRIYFAILTLELIAVAFDISWLFAGLENYLYIVLRNTFVKFAGIIALFLFVKEKGDLPIYVAVIAASRLIGNLSMWYKINKIIDKPVFLEFHIKKHFKETMAYFIPTIASSVYTYLDKAMIGMITNSSAENGYYYQCGKIIQLAYTVTVSLNTVMVSRISYLFAQNNTKEIKAKLEKALAFILTIAIPIMFGIIGIAPNFVPWFFGDGFDKVIILLEISSPLVLLQSLHNYLSSQYLIPSGQRVRSTKAVIIGSIVNFICNAIFIPRFQSIGATIGTLIGESVIFLIYFYMSKEVVSYRWFFIYLPKQLFSALIMLLCVKLIERLSLNPILISIIQISAGCCIYFVALIILREKFVIGILKEMKRRLFAR